jgi:hypothetical protein
MKLNSAQIDKTLHQFDAEPIPAEHPAVPKLQQLFGEHTYFLNSKGLNVVEPLEDEQNTGRRSVGRGVVVNVASWTDEKAETLQPHEPVPTELVVDLEIDRSH